MKTVEEQSKKQVLTPAQRGGEVVSLTVMLLVCGFFISHQMTRTCFFTAKYGTMEIICICTSSRLEKKEGGHSWLQPITSILLTA